MLTLAPAFDEGTDLFKKNKFVEAAQSFREAYRLKPTWKLLFNIGQSEAAASRYGLSLETFERYLAEGGDEIVGSRRDEVLAEVKRLREMVGSIEVDAPDGAQVTIDDVPRGICPLMGSLMVAAGVVHNVEVTLEGATLLSRKIKVSGGKDMKLTATNEDTSPQPEEPAQEETSPIEVDPTTDNGALRTAGWVTIGVGGALLIAGGVTGGMALSMNGEIDEDCGDGSCLASQRKEDVDKRDSLALATDIMLGVGAAAAIAGIVMVVVGRDDETEKSVSIGPLLAPDAVGARAAWRF